jgi:uncharacterized membrane protein
MIPERRVPPRRATSTTLTIGTLLGAACFAIALVADLAGVRSVASGGSDLASSLGSYLASLAALDPTAWGRLGSAVIIATPAVGLVVTGLEYGSIGDRRAVLMAVAVLAILATSLLVALLT